MIPILTNKNLLSKKIEENQSRYTAKSPADDFIVNKINIPKKYTTQDYINKVKQERMESKGISSVFKPEVVLNPDTIKKTKESLAKKLTGIDIFGEEQIAIERGEREEMLANLGLTERQKRFSRLLPTTSQLQTAAIGATVPLKPVTGAQATNLISKANKLNWQDIADITSGKIKSGAKYEAYKAISQDKALLQKALARKGKSSFAKTLKEVIDDVSRDAKSFIDDFKSKYGREPKPSEIKFLQSPEKQAITTTQPTKVGIAKNKPIKVGNLNIPATQSKEVATDPLIQEAKKYKSAEEFVFDKRTSGFDEIIKERDIKIGKIQEKIDAIEKANTRDIGVRQGESKIRQINKLKKQQSQIRLDTESKEDFLIDKAVGSKSQLTDIWNQAQELPKKETKSGKQQLAEREQAKIDREQAKLKRETLQFQDEELENQYQDFKKLKVKDTEDVAQLKAKNKLDKVDDILYSQDKSSDEVFDMFKERYSQEREALPTIPKETKAIVKEKGRLKGVVQGITKGIKDGSIKTRAEIKEAQDFVVATLKDSNLELADKAKFITTIKNIQTLDQLQKALPKITERISRLEEADLKRGVIEQINTEYKFTKPVRRGAISVSKYDYETNKFIQGLKETNKLTKENAQEELLKIKTDPEVPLSEMEKIRNRLISYKANGMNSSLVLQEQVLSDIQYIKELGEKTKDVADFEKKLEKQELKEEVLKGIQTQKESKVILKQLKSGYISSVSNLYSSLNAIAGKKIADKYDYGMYQTNSKQDSFVKTEEFKNKAKEIYNLKNDKQLTKIFIDDLAKADYVMTDIEGFSEEVSKFDLMNIYNGIKNDLIRERYYNFFGEDQVTSLLQNLNPEEAQLADYLMEEVQSYKDVLNQRSIEIRGLDNGTVENYWPSSSEYIPEFFDDIRIQGELPSAIKSRSKSSSVIPKKANAWMLAQRHIAEAEHVKTVSRKYEELKNIFSDRIVRKTIEKKYGESSYDALMKNIETFSLNYRSEGLDVVSGIYNKGLNNWVKAKVGSPTVFARQMISSIYSVESVGIKNFTKYQKEFATNPQKVFRYMWDNVPFIKNRFKMGYSEALEDVIRGTKKMNIGMDSITKYTTLMTRGGDITAIVLNGYPIIKTEMAKHGNMEKAIEVFQKFSEKTQQSGSNANLSDPQRSKSAWHKTFFRFKNTTNQLLRLQIDANIQLANGQISIGEYANKTLLYSVYTPMMYVLIGYGITQGWKKLFGTDDEEEKESLMGDILQNMILQPFQAIPFLDMSMEWTYNKLRGKITGNDNSYGMFSYPLFDDIERAGSKLAKKEPSAMDVIEAMSLLQEPFTGIPTGTMLRYFKYAKGKEKKKQSGIFPGLPELPGLPKLPSLPSLPKLPKL